MTEPAIVYGNHRRAIATFIEDSRGDLVDIVYKCLPCAWPDDDGAWGPAHEFGDYDTYCETCAELINCPRDCEEHA